jgi:uncharacterized protein YdhG (YjbR/CyaY superfamily)
MLKATYRTVDEYIQGQPEAVKDVLARVRAAIRKAVPRADESIAYGMPAYKLDGRPLIYFAGWKKHYSLYPVTARLVGEFREELAPYEVEKGTLSSPFEGHLPATLIGRIAKFRAREIAEEGSKA